MSHEPTDTAALQRVKRVSERADALVARGRLTEHEAGRLKAASEPAEAERIVREISERHLAERLEASVARGSMTRQEAERTLERVRRGEHVGSLHQHPDRPADTGDPKRLGKAVPVPRDPEHG